MKHLGVVDQNAFFSGNIEFGQRAVGGKRNGGQTQRGKRNGSNIVFFNQSI